MNGSRKDYLVCLETVIYSSLEQMAELSAREEVVYRMQNIRELQDHLASVCGAITFYIFKFQRGSLDR